MSDYYRNQAEIADDEPYPKEDDQGDDDDSTFTWLAEGAFDIVERCKQLSKDNASMEEWIAELRLELKKAQARSASAAKLEDENARLKTELVVVGPASAEEELQLVRKQLATRDAELQVALRQRDALAQALRQERLQREHIEETDLGRRQFAASGTDDRNHPQLQPKTKTILDVTATVAEGIEARHLKEGGP